MKDCEDCTMNTICTYYDKEQKKASGNCPGWRWYRKCWIILILIALLLSGCSNKSLHETVWDAEGNLIKQIDVSVSSYFLHTEARNIIAITKDKFLFVGDLSQIPDTESGFGLFLDLILKGLVP